MGGRPERLRNWLEEEVRRASKHSGSMVGKKDWSKHTAPY